jgi:hypothetical protein
MDFGPEEMEDFDQTFAEIAQELAESEKMDEKMDEDTHQVQMEEMEQDKFLEYEEPPLLVSNLNKDIVNESLNLSHLLSPSLHTSIHSPEVINPDQNLIPSSSSQSQGKVIDQIKLKNPTEGLKIKIVGGSGDEARVEKMPPENDTEEEASNKVARPRLKMRFKLLSPPNPLSPQLIADLERGTLLTSEVLLKGGTAARPMVSNPYGRYAAISKSFYIDKQRDEPIRH